MKRKFEDKVAQLAFGDLSPEESAKLEQEVHSNPEALRALSLYKDMREGLRGLSEIPEDQFSKERLRDAILTRGLKPVAVRPTSNRSWLWMPSAACVMGFALMFSMNMRHRAVRTPNIVLNPPKHYSLGEPITLPTRVAVLDNTSSHSPFGKPMPVNSDLAAHLTAKVDPDEVDPRIVANNIDGGFEDASYDPDLGSGPSTSAKPATATSGVLAKNDTINPAGSAASSSIILIDQEKDAETGACKATEVGSASNVLIGG